LLRAHFMFRSDQDDFTATLSGVGWSNATFLASIRQAGLASVSG
jgi:hypothetical protein